MALSKSETIADDNVIFPMIIKNDNESEEKNSVLNSLLGKFNKNHNQAIIEESFPLLVISLISWVKKHAKSIILEYQDEPAHIRLSLDSTIDKDDLKYFFRLYSMLTLEDLIGLNFDLEDKIICKIPLIPS